MANPRSFDKGKKDPIKAPAKTQVKSHDSIEEKEPTAKVPKRSTKPAPKKQGP